MNRLHEAIGLGLILGILHGFAQPAYSVPVVPNFTQGSMTSTTETTSTITETINSIDYNTGYTYTVTGTNIKSNAGLAPSSVSGQSNTNNGVTSTWTGLNMNNRPTFSIETPGAPFQFVESYTGCLLYTSPSPRDKRQSRMPSSA